MFTPAVSISQKHFVSSKLKKLTSLFVFFVKARTKTAHKIYTYVCDEFFELCNVWKDNYLFKEFFYVFSLNVISHHDLTGNVSFLFIR